MICFALERRRSIRDREISQGGWLARTRAWTLVLGRVFVFDRLHIKWVGAVPAGSTHPLMSLDLGLELGNEQCDFCKIRHPTATTNLAGVPEQLVPILEGVPIDGMSLQAERAGYRCAEVVRQTSV